MHSISVVFTQTHTFVGSVIRIVTGGKYNHCSLIIDNDFSRLYSFSRYYTKFWFTGCFCIETISKLAFGKKVLNGAIAEINITDSEYDKIVRFIEYMGKGVRIYNYINAVLVPLRISIDSDSSYICSTFVARIITFIDKINLDKKYSLYKPMDLYYLLKDFIYYEGDLISFIERRLL